VTELEKLSNHSSKLPGRVLYVIGSLAVGGAERHVVAVASALQRRGWQTTVFALSLQGPLLSALKEAGVTVKGPNLPVWLASILGQRLGAWFRSALAVAMIAIELRRHPGAVSHFFLPSAYILGGLAAWFVNAYPRVMSRRSLNLYQIKHPRYRMLERFLHARMDTLLGNSLAVVKELHAEASGRTPVRLIYNGIESKRIQHGLRERTRIELGLDGGMLAILVVANLIPYKGHEDLLSALGLVKESLPANWRLLCVGRDDGIGTLLQEQARILGIETNVMFLGPRICVEEYFAAADIAVSASHEEGFSNAVLEAMRAGLPIVVTDVGGNPEAVVNRVTGYVVPSHNPKALGSSILKLALNPHRAEMGARGRARVVEKFSMEACLDAYEKLYFDLKSKRR
jgi:glycosyltransferase involved in cell wall biosynthesis